ncbi:hypothetical protein FSP39_023400 [Pinctada imbricata]|uniref:FAD-binding PCMH-type domain-containing protein n=1 Tax=Pinctada imbricata TaxID=66713 RepID=A0AA88XU23_PINIB|nr:hypothetical protein FSP39_023400 [Pinctada imbricata]
MTMSVQNSLEKSGPRPPVLSECRSESSDDNMHELAKADRPSTNRLLPNVCLYNDEIFRFGTCLGLPSLAEKQKRHKQENTENCYSCYVKAVLQEVAAFNYLVCEVTLQFAWFLGLISLGLTVGERRCFPGEPCFPSKEAFADFQNELEGSMLFPNDTDYDSMILMHNVWRMKEPFAVVVAASTSDVQKAVVFARTYNLHFHVKTSGHDYNGRSTASKSLEINLSKMNKSTVMLNSSRAEAGEIMVESGNRWVDVYEEVDKYDRVIVGGSAHTVSMGGYTLGGGHSPMCRMLGMAVDNLLEVEMVSANGSIVRATANYTSITNSDGSIQNTTDTDIFWALSGGGGGTFGIATRFYFRLHHSPTKVVRMSLIYPILLGDGTNVGLYVLGKFAEILPNLPRQWGGYVIIAWNYDTTYHTTGYLYFFMNHFGPADTESFNYIKQLADFIPSLRYVEYKTYDTFWEYEETVNDPLYINGYVFNSLLHNGSFTDGLAHFIVSTVLNKTDPNIGAGFTGTLTGGKMMEVSADATSVHPGFRRSLMSLSGGIVWDKSYDYNIPENIKYGASLSEELQQYGDGMYPNEAGADVKNWQQAFWGANYDRLLEIKQKWDPEYYFICRECVGSEYYDKTNENTTEKPTGKSPTTVSTTKSSSAFSTKGSSSKTSTMTSSSASTTSSSTTYVMTMNELSSTSNTKSTGPRISQTRTSQVAMSATETTVTTTFKVNDISAASYTEALKIQYVISVISLLVLLKSNSY